MITELDRQALEAVKDGGDVFNRGLAVVLRGLEPEGLVKIGPPAGEYAAETRQPYFGAIVSNSGLALLAEHGKWKGGAR